MRLVDANVLIYAVNEESTEHERSRRWLDASLSGGDAIGFAWIALLAFIRLTSHRAVFARPLEAAAAIDNVRQWLAQPSAVVLEPTSRHVDLLAALLRETGAAGNLVNDAHLAALASEHDAVLVSFDADYGRFHGLRWEPPST